MRVDEVHPFADLRVRECSLGLLYSLLLEVTDVFFFDVKLLKTTEEHWTQLQFVTTTGKYSEKKNVCACYSMLWVWLRTRTLLDSWSLDLRGSLRLTYVSYFCKAVNCLDYVDFPLHSFPMRPFLHFFSSVLQDLNLLPHIPWYIEDFNGPGPLVSTAPSKT